MRVGWLKNGKTTAPATSERSTCRLPANRRTQYSASANFGPPQSIKPSADSRQPLYPYTFPLPVNLDAVDIISGDDTLQFCIRRCLLHPTDLTPTRNKCHHRTATARRQPAPATLRVPWNTGSPSTVAIHPRLAPKGRGRAKRMEAQARTRAGCEMPATFLCPMLSIIAMRHRVEVDATEDIPSSTHTHALIPFARQPSPVHG